jgi:hypothetical protein
VGLLLLLLEEVVKIIIGHVFISGPILTEAIGWLMMLAIVVAAHS